MICPLCSGDTDDLGKHPCLDNWESHVLVCKDCLSLFRHPMPSADQLGAYYNQRTFSPKKTLLKRRLRKARRQAKWIDRFMHEMSLNKDAPILDLGAGIGGLEFSMRERGFVNITSLEGRPAAIDFARRELGVNLKQGWVFDAHRYSNGPQVLLLSHVLEHLSDPVEILDYLKKVFPGALLWIEVPDGSRDVHRTDRETVWSLWLEQHLWSFTPDGLSTLLQENGAEVLRMEQGASYAGYTAVRDAELRLAGDLVESGRHGSLSLRRTLPLLARLAFTNTSVQLYKQLVSHIPFYSEPDTPYHIRLVVRLPA